MVDDATTLLELLELLVHDEELIETPFNVVVFQQLCNKKVARKLVCTRVNLLA
jgi:hypothetical protein